MSHSAAVAVGKRAFRDARTRTFAFAAAFLIYAWIQPVGYRHTYSTAESRQAFAASLGNNKGLRVIYGSPRDLLTDGGYTEWRVGGTLAIVAAAFGVLAAVRAFRAEEDAGRTELVLAGVLNRMTLYGSSLAAIAAGAAILGAAQFVGFVAAGLDVSASFIQALATISIIPVFVGVGTVASQLASTRRLALILGGEAIGLALLLRAVADTAHGARWLHWLTPLGWSQEVRAFTDSRPLLLLLLVGAAAALLLVGGLLADRRDVGAGLLPSRAVRDPDLRLLSSPTAQALRLERGSLLAWLTSVGVFAFILGVVSNGVSSAGISKSVEQQIAKLGSGSILTPVGYLSFVFFFFVLAVSLFACGQVAGARHDEADERLETLLALPVSRARWLGGRLLLAVAGVVVLSAVAGILTWVGARAAGVGVSTWDMLAAGLNCVPVALLFLGFAALAYGALPRASTGIAYGLVVAAFLWQAVGSLLGVPHALVSLTPFAHVGLVPTQSFRAGAAALMVGIGAVAAALALAAFRRRDLLGA